MDNAGGVIGLGFFSSLFAAPGIAIFSSGLLIIFKSDNIGQCVIGIFPMLFALPFMAVPIIMSLTMGIWGIAITGYSLAFTYIACLVLGKTTNVCNARNPCQIGGSNRRTSQPQSHRIQPPVAVPASPLILNNINNNNNYANLNAHMRSPMENHYNQHNSRLQNGINFNHNNNTNEQMEGFPDTMHPPSYNEPPAYYAEEAPPPPYHPQ